MVIVLTQHTHTHKQQNPSDQTSFSATKKLPEPTQTAVGNFAFFLDKVAAVITEETPRVVLGSQISRVVGVKRRSAEVAGVSSCPIYNAKPTGEHQTPNWRHVRKQERRPCVSPAKSWIPWCIKTCFNPGESHRTQGWLFLVLDTVPT